MNIEFLTFLRREIYRFIVLYKQTIVPALISSLLYIIVFGTTLGARISSIDGVPYINFIVPGLAMMSVINQSYQNSASSIMQGKYLKFIEDILIAPLSGFEISLGYIIGGALRGLICGLGILIICLFMTDFKIENFMLTIFYLLTVSWTFSAFGVIIGVYAKSWDEIGSFTNFIFMPMTFLGGVFYSLDMLPTFWRNVSYINPIYWMISGLRYATIGLEENSNLISLTLCFGFSCLFTALATYLFKTGYKIKS
jgi:ABC-2 type transport system permease protein